MQSGSAALIILAGLMLCACSLQDENAGELPKLNQDTAPAADEIFVQKAQQCTRGKLEFLPELTRAYTLSFKDAANPDYLKLQREVPTHAFEACAQKAMLQGNQQAMGLIIANPADCAQLAKAFYARRDEVSGAFWLRRLINLTGEANAYNQAGQLMLNDAATHQIGLDLIEAAHAAALLPDQQED